MGLNLNLLPEDGISNYFSYFLTQNESLYFFTKLIQDINWHQDEIMMFGKKITTQRKVAWIGDPNCSYKYSGVLKVPQGWTSELLTLKAKVEKLAECEFNSCLLNLYNNGNEGMGWHSDNEASLMSKRHETVIASLSFGATRKMRFKHNYTGNLVELLLQSGQLIVMRGQTQQFWKHQISKTTKVITPRINLTFRYFYPEN